MRKIYGLVAAKNVDKGYCVIKMARIKWKGHLGTRKKFLQEFYRADQRRRKRKGRLKKDVVEQFRGEPDETPCTKTKAGGQKLGPSIDCRRSRKWLLCVATASEYFRPDSVVSWILWRHKCVSKFNGGLAVCLYLC